MIRVTARTYHCHLQNSKARISQAQSADCRCTKARETVEIFSSRMPSMRSPSYGVEKGHSYVVGTAVIHTGWRGTANGKISELICNLIRGKGETNA